MRYPLIVAHRGASALQPENSLDAMRCAFELGADLVETDLRLSRDGAVMCCHDADLLRIAGREQRVADLEARDLQAASVPLLADLLAALGTEARLMLDCKLDGEAYWRAILAVISGAGHPMEQLHFGIRSVIAAHELRALAPDARMVGLVPSPDQLTAFHAAGAGALRLWQRDADERALAQIRDLGAQCWITMGRAGDGSAGDADATNLRRILAICPDAILVNDPILALDLRNQQGALA